MPEPQSFKNHGRLDPPQHFIAVPILFINFIACIVITVRIAISHEPRMLGLHIWLVIVSFALLVAAVNMRVKDLRVQDRVIRLEERVRYAALLQPQSSRQRQHSHCVRSLPCGSRRMRSSPRSSFAPSPRT